MAAYHDTDAGDSSVNAFRDGRRSVDLEPPQAFEDWNKHDEHRRSLYQPPEYYHRPHAWMQQRTRRKLSACTLGFLVLIGVVVITSDFLFGPKHYHKLPWNAKRKGLITATLKHTNTTWLKDVPEDWEIFNYVADDPAAEYSLPRNQGGEAMAYITFVYDHYDVLPDYMVFAHGHEKSWHQPEPMPFILKALDLRVLDQLGWVSLRCALQNTCEGPDRYVQPHKVIEWDLNRILIEMHKFVVRPDDPWYEPLPDQFAVPCCGQFAVTKKQAHSKPREYWRRLRMILTRDYDKDFLDWPIAPEGPPISWKLGGVFEFTWHWWFGMKSIVCLETEYCRNTVFQGKIHCDGKTWDWATAQPIWQNITCTFDE